ncbi:MAG: hypothetical protein GY869_16640 [Planctomycetes bacterium]|nr:hypothetical protein [Planctomycetota bacterium]
MPNHQCGAALSLVGFGISLIIGLWVDNPFVTVVLRGLWVLVLFYILGCLLSVIGQKVIQENFENEVKSNEYSNQQQLGSIENENTIDSEPIIDRTPSEAVSQT